jgi:hypothetical protein
MTHERKQEYIGKLIARQGDEFIVLDYIFDHGDGFKGAVGSRIRPVSQSEYEERTSDDAIEEYCEELWKCGVADGVERRSLAEFAEAFKDEDGTDSMFDGSYSRWPQIRAKGFPEDSSDAEDDYEGEFYPIMECTGGGRCFGHDDEYDEVYDEELLARIRAIESPRISADSPTLAG